MATKPISGYQAAPLLGLGYRSVSAGIALIAIWVSAIIAAVYSPDMISGANHEHLQLAMFFAFPLAAVATAMVLLAAGVSRRATQAGPWTVYAVVTAIAWAGYAVASVFASPMVTGTDPTTIPLAGVLGPVFAVLVTAYASIYVAGAGES